MIYRGYTAWYAHEPQDDVLYGYIAGIRDMFTFAAPTMEDLEREFHASVDDYLSFCEEHGRKPDAPPNPHGLTSLGSSYKGFTGSFEVDPDNGVLHGHVDGIADVIIFEADRLWDLERKFRTHVDEYLERCVEDAVEPNRAYAEPTRAAS